jgi:hypothetical protein
MAYEAERLINRHLSRFRARVILLIVSHVGAALIGSALTLAVVILIRKI